MTRTRSLALFLALAPLALGSKCGPDETPVDDGPTDVTPPEVRLQVVSVDPAHGAIMTPWAAELYGAEFQQGAKVRIGDAVASRAEWQNENTLGITVPALPEGVYDVTVTNPDGEQAVLRRGVQVAGDASGAACRHMVVYFEFDSPDLRSDALSLLGAQAGCLQQARGTVRIEGHCDERGTTDYNLSLGERRAYSVQRFLTQQGISPSRLSTVSFGEERPAARGHDESAWQQNRRVEIFLQD